MKNLRPNGTGNDRLTENERRQLEDGLRVLAKIITRAVLREESGLDGPRHEKCRDSTEYHHQIAAAGKPGESLTLGVKATAEILGLSLASTYEAVRTGQIPSIRFGKRITVPRAALSKLLSQTDADKDGHG